MSSRYVDQRVATARPGRPPTLTKAERQSLILEAAEQVFTEIGYGAATMEEIARRAGMSKKTLYALYSDKRSLFAALISDVDFPFAALPTGAVPSRAELRKQLLTLSALAVGERQVEMTRLVISEAKQCPELAEEFHDRVIRRTERYLADALHAYGKKDDTAATLVGAILGDQHLRMLLGVKPLSRQRVEALLDNAIDLMLPNPRN